MLAKDEVTYVGEPVAMVVAESRRIAEDALALVALDIEALPAVADPVAGSTRCAAGAPRCPDNLVARRRSTMATSTARSRAAHRIAARFRLHKGGGHSIEPRGVAVRLDAPDDALTVYANTQLPHRAKQILVAALGSANNASAWSRPTPAAASAQRPRSIRKSWRCPLQRCCSESR